ncbi:hypothetical protein M8J76_011322 [Diaphorina citri]|nr:hypothetical protein M8J76_011322 [Diaphorina citri]
MSTDSKPGMNKTSKKNSKQKRNPFVEVDAPVGVSSKKKKVSVRKGLEIRSVEEHDPANIENTPDDNIQTNDFIFPVSEEWQESQGNENEASNINQTSQATTDDTVSRSGTMNIFDKKRFNLSYYLESNRRAILRCCPDTVINFNGIINVKVLQGAIKVAGYTVTKEETKPIKIYSLNAYNYLPIHLLRTDRDKVKKNKLTKIMTELGVSRGNIHVILNCLEPKQCLLYVESAAEYSVSVQDKVLFHMIHQLNISIPHLLPDRAHFRQTQYTDLLEKHLKIQFFKTVNSTIGAPVLMEPEEWGDLFEQCVKPHQNARLVLCGGSGLGKTTLLRYLINRSIQEFDRALVIDLDPGQSEFYLPGTLSATLIEEPLLGPNFTHIQNRPRLPERCYFLGDIKIHAITHNYLTHLDAILNYCNNEERFASIPWFINTMGYVKDQGILLNCRIIQDAKPTHVIQIQGKKPDDNFPADLTPSFVRKNAYQSHRGDRTMSTGHDLDYQLVPLQSVKNKPFDNVNKSLKPADKRKNVLIAYFSAMYSALETEYSVNQLTPYGCLLKHLHVEVVNKPSGQLRRHEILAAMNGEMVALCTRSANNEVSAAEAPQCLGYGIVYCIDPDRRELYLLTPLSLTQMCRVKTLQLGSPAVAMPRKFLDARCKELYGARLPYATTGQGQVTSKTPTRTYRQPSRFQQRAARSS